MSTFFFFNDPATTEIYTLSLHDALPISSLARPATFRAAKKARGPANHYRSEEHTSELQSLAYLVCRLLLEKKKKYNFHHKQKDEEQKQQSYTHTIQHHHHLAM